MPSDKNTARQHGLMRRALLSEEERKAKDREIREKVIGRIKDVSLIGTYVSFKEEADTREIISWCFANGKRVAVPKVSGNTLVFHEIHSFSDLGKGAYGIEEPYRDSPVPVEEIEFMIVPLSAFDEAGHRTGYGKGYYDSVLARCAHSAGLAYDVQKSDEIIIDPWDVTLDEIICA